MRQQGKRVIGKVEILARNDDAAAKVAAFRLTSGSEACRETV
jgi:hypothetical protein